MSVLMERVIGHALTACLLAAITFLYLTLHGSEKSEPAAAALAASANPKSTLDQATAGSPQNHALLLNNRPLSVAPVEDMREKIEMSSGEELSSQFPSLRAFAIEHKGDALVALIDRIDECIPLEVDSNNSLRKFSDQTLDTQEFAKQQDRNLEQELANFHQERCAAVNANILNDLISLKKIASDAGMARFVLEKVRIDADALLNANIRNLSPDQPAVAQLVQLAKQGEVDAMSMLLRLDQNEQIVWSDTRTIDVVTAAMLQSGGEFNDQQAHEFFSDLPEFHRPSAVAEARNLYGRCCAVKK